MAMVVLVNAPCPSIWKHNHLGLSYLANYLEMNGISTRIMDLNASGKDPSDLFQTVRETEPILIGFTIFRNNYENTRQLIVELRKQGYRGHMTSGGYTATLKYDRVLCDINELDSIVLGEGEITLLELVQRQVAAEDWMSIPGIAYRNENRVIRSSISRLISDLDLLPNSYRDEYVETIQHANFVDLCTSRGCRMACSYCTVNSFYRISRGKKFRCFSPEHMIEEIEAYITGTGVTRFCFDDDDFLGDIHTNRERIERFGQLLRGMKPDITFKVHCRPDMLDLDVLLMLKEVGLSHIAIGVESVVDRQLELYNKRTTPDDGRRGVEIVQQAGIPYEIYMIIADPYVTAEDALKNVDFIENHSGHLTRSGWLGEILPHPGTAMRKRLIADGIVDDDTLAIGGADQIDVTRLEGETRKIFEIRRLVQSRRTIYRDFLDEMLSDVLDSCQRWFIEENLVPEIEKQYLSFFCHFLVNIDQATASESVEKIDAIQDAINRLLESVDACFYSENYPQKDPIRFEILSTVLVFDREEILGGIALKLLEDQGVFSGFCQLTNGRKSDEASSSHSSK